MVVVASFVLDSTARAGRAQLGCRRHGEVMTKLRTIARIAVGIAALVIAAAPAQAQVTRVESGRNAIGFNIGYFSVRGADSRVDDDVLIQDLSQGAYSLAFDVKDFNGATFGGEWVLGV